MWIYWKCLLAPVSCLDKQIKREWVKFPNPNMIKGYLSSGLSQGSDLSAANAMAGLAFLHTSSLLLTTSCSIKMAVTDHKAHQMGVPYQLKQGQTRIFHQLPSGLEMEVITQKKNPNDRTGKSDLNPPLLFIHGSYHAAWCWAEHWFPFFSTNGFDCYAVSLLGQVRPSFPLFCNFPALLILPK